MLIYFLLPLIAVALLCVPFIFTAKKIKNGKSPKGAFIGNLCTFAGIMLCALIVLGQAPLFILHGDRERCSAEYAHQWYYDKENDERSGHDFYIEHERSNKSCCHVAVEHKSCNAVTAENGFFVILIFKADIDIEYH